MGAPKQPEPSMTRSKLEFLKNHVASDQRQVFGAGRRFPRCFPLQWRPLPVSPATKRYGSPVPILVVVDFGGRNDRLDESCCVGY